MYSEIVTALSGLKTMSDLTKLVLRAKVDSAVTEKAIESQTAIISLQSAMLELYQPHAVANPHGHVICCVFVNSEHPGQRPIRYGPPGINQRVNSQKPLMQIDPRSGKNRPRGDAKIGITRVAMVTSGRRCRSATASLTVRADRSAFPAKLRENETALMRRWKLRPHLSQRHHSPLTLVEAGLGCICLEVGQDCRELGQPVA